MSDLSVAIAGWTSQTRISPVWSVTLGTNDQPPQDHRFPGEYDLMFLGPVQPARLAAEVRLFREASDVSVWVSPGAFNVLIGIPRSASAQRNVRELVKWATGSKTPYEIWRIKDGIVDGKPRMAERTMPPETALLPLSQLAKEADPPALRAAVQEYLCLMASALTRSMAVHPPISADLASVSSSMATLITDARRGSIPYADAQSQLLSMNAALSRFSSQAFSGTSPISGTECHFWIHSLLGVGAANIALRRLVTYVQSILGEARLPERVKALAEISYGTPSLAALTTDPSLPNFDIIQRTATSTSEAAAIPPLVTYFSGRDGFSSHLQTLSAPLTTITECNSYRYNLLTVTHELSHIFIHGILPIVYPAFTSEQDLARAKSYIAPRYQADNWLDAARQLLVEGLVSMQQSAQEREYDLDELTEKMPTILKRWRRESQEILVHTFDFMYFYGGNAEFYIKGIWQSWCAIPGISERIPEYVLRCLCALSSALLRENPRTAFLTVLRELKTSLGTLVSGGTLLSNYAAEAIEIIEKAEDDPKSFDRLFDQYKSRMYFTRFVAVFLFSDSLSRTLFNEPFVAAGRQSGVYANTTLEFGTERIGNPLRFLKEHLKDTPGPAESLWVLFHLAFNSLDDEDSR